MNSIVIAVISAYDNGVIATSNSSSEPNWDVVSSIFFAVTVVTTIGMFSYGIKRILLPCS